MREGTFWNGTCLRTGLRGKVPSNVLEEVAVSIQSTSVADLLIKGILNLYFGGTSKRTSKMPFKVHTTLNDLAQFIFKEFNISMDKGFDFTIREANMTFSS